MSAETQISPYVRQASGLRREFGTYDVFVFNVLTYAMGLVLAVTPTFLGGLQPHASIYAVLTFGLVLCMCNGVTYALFGAAMPRSGGDYVFIGRTLSPGIGFIANWGLTWSQFIGLGVYSTWCVTDALAPALSTLGYVAAYDRLVEAGAGLLPPGAVFLVGTLLLGTVLIITLFGMRLVKTLLNLLFLVAIAGTLAMLYVFLTTDHERFVTVFNSFMQQHANIEGAYDHVIQAAVAEGLQTNQPTRLSAALLALPVGFWIFIGFNFSVYIGAEIRRPERAQTIGIFGGLAFGYVLYMLVLGRYYAVVGRDFNNALALLPSGPDGIMPVGNSMTFLAGLCTQSTLLNALMGVSTFLWFFLLLLVMAQVCIRNVFAWSFDGLMPLGLARVSSRGIPWVAAVVIVLVAEVFLALNAFWGIAFINYIALIAACSLVTGVAGIVFPYRRPELFARAPDIVRRRVMGLPLISIASALNTALFAIVLYSALANPDFTGVAVGFPTVFFFGVYVLGALYYFAYTRIARKQGMIDVLYEDIPPA